MAKQIKIGFDKVPSPVTKQYPQLKDIFGADLVDSAGNPLRTEEDAVLGVFTEAEQSLSVHVNNSAEDQVRFEVAGGYIDNANTGGQSEVVTVPGTFYAELGNNIIAYETTLSIESSDVAWDSGYTVSEALQDVQYIYIPHEYNPSDTGYVSNKYVPPGNYYLIEGIDPSNNKVTISPPFRGNTDSGYTALKANRIADTAQAVPVEEQFPAESEVSSTLLGVPRAEEQLSLFSDVAVYGLDEDNWNYYTYNPNSYPGEWYRKENPIFGRRSAPRFEEASEEQGLYLYSFPSQFDFPGGPRRSGGEVSNTFREYLNFIAFGKYLYELYVNQYPLFAEQNFINRDITILNDSITDTIEDRKVDIDSTSYNTDTDPPQINNVSGTTAIAYDIDYGDDIQLGFDQVERWTTFWQKIKDGIAIFPDIAGQPVPFQATELVRSFRPFTQQLTQAGGGSSTTRYGILESQRTFRYQPGRVSGFTYGVRLKSDIRSEDNIIEWGVSNETDEYMFQVRGTKLNIVRRSVISLFENDTGQNSINETQAKRMGFANSDEAISAERLVTPITLKNDEELKPEREGNSGTHYELVLEREKWNGDRLDGTGQSGYTLTFEEVTMYKIEFSWYGAIGAKFYAYVPSGNGEARWVLMHTLVIENGLGQPCLRNPDFKFKYFLYSPETSQLEQPLYIYKYGSSYYIDGGDEGTVRLSSVSGDSKEFTQRTPIMGIMPKERILNGDGHALTNYKKSYPNQVSVTSTQDVRIDIEQVQGSPEGHHFYFAPGLQSNTASSYTANLVFSSTGNSIEYADDTLSWQPEDDGAHIIANGVYGCYVGYNQNNASGGSAFVADLKRKQGSFDEPTTGAEIEPFTLKTNGEVFETRTGEAFEARVTNFNDVAASTVPINTTKFKIHFLNPRPSSEFGRHSSDFLVGVTQKEPVIDTNDEDKLKFDDGAGNLEEVNLIENPTVIWSNTSVRLDLKNREDTEWEPGFGDRFLIDPRLPAPQGDNSGGISTVTGEITLVSFGVTAITEETEGEFAGDYKIEFSGGGPTITADPADPTRALENAVEVGVQSEALGIYYTSTVFTVDGTSFAYVGGNIVAAAAAKGISEVTAVQSAQLKLTDDFKLGGATGQFSNLRFEKTRLVNFNVLPLYPFFAMQDNCQINNIVIEEISPAGNFTKTPVWLYSPNSGISPTPNPTLPFGVSGQSEEFLPSSFNSTDRLSAVRFDVACQQPLRSGIPINSFYVGANQTVRVDLSNIFNPDRKALARGLLNNKAIYLTASAIDGSGGDVELAVTVKEQ